MLKTTEKLIDLGFRNQVFLERDLVRLFNGTAASRYGLVNKALKKKEWIRICRGAYILEEKYRTAKLSKFFIASHLCPGSYVSFESALSYHGWIPERVTVVTSAIGKGRAHAFTTPLGELNYIKIVTNEYEYLNNVTREEIDARPFFIARPLRALADYVYHKKVKWSDIRFLTDSLRIDEENLNSLTSQDFDQIMLVYSSKRVVSFFKHLRRELKK